MRPSIHLHQLLQIRLRIQAVFVLFILFGSIVMAQKKVAITIDDLPNTYKFKADHFEPILLNKLDSLDIPVTVFFNEGKLVKTDAQSENFALLSDWCEHPNVTLGNHTRDHVRYSEVGLEKFKENLEAGETTTKSFAKRFGKPLTYFRFPYNDLGADSIQRAQVELYLEKRNYVIAPFTIESSDWMFNKVYEYHLKNGDKEKAQKVGEDYVEATLQLFEFFNDLAVKQYGREVNQIYLCHDNSINADYLDVLVDSLAKRDYSIISMEDAMKDEIYQQENVYNFKWGVSWFYRWMDNSRDRFKIMMAEPELKDIKKEYDRLFSQEK